MADSIVDGRTNLTTNDGTGLDDVSGAASGSTNTGTFVEGTGSQSTKVSMAVDGLLYDAGSAQTWGGNVFYIYWQCTTPGLLDTLANGGVRVRFCGNTVTDFFEIYIAGSDLIPPSVAAGFIMTVVDIDEARTQATGAGPGGTGGTTPLASAIRYVGIVWDVPGSVPGNVDNCYIDAMWRLPASTPGIRVEGLNGGTTDWTWQDIIDAADVNDTTKAWGTIYRLSNGSININTPIRFGVDDTDGHGFADTNENVGWEDALVPDGFYGIDVIGNSGGTTDFDSGLKTGTGDDATGAQGGSITSGGPRWFLDINDPDVDNVNLYGMTLSGAGAITADDAAVEIISCTILDCTSLLATGITEFLRNSIVNANTADGVAFLTTDDLGDVVFCSFFFSDGHGVELTTPRVASQTSKGNRFSGYGITTSNDAAVYNNTAGAVTITLSEGATSAEHTYRDGTSASTTVVANSVTLTITATDINDASVVQNARALVYAATGGSMPADVAVSIVQTGGTATVTHTSHGLSNNDLVVIDGGDTLQSGYRGVHTITVTGASTYTYSVPSGTGSPAVGSPLASEAIISALTNASGQVTDTRSYGSNQPIRGFVRRGTSSPVYKTSPLLGNTIDSSNGLTIAVQLIPDE